MGATAADGFGDLLVIPGVGANEIRAALGVGREVTGERVGGLVMAAHVDFIDVVKVGPEERIPPPGHFAALHALLHVSDVKVDPVEAAWFSRLDLDGVAILVLGDGALDQSAGLVQLAAPPACFVAGYEVTLMVIRTALNEVSRSVVEIKLAVIIIGTDSGVVVTISVPEKLGNVSARAKVAAKTIA